MGSFSIWHWLVVLLVVLLLFGSGKISGLMGDLATGIKSFKKNIKEDEPDASMADTTMAPPAGNLPPPGVHAASTDASRTTVRTPPGA